MIQKEVLSTFFSSTGLNRKATLSTYVENNTRYFHVECIKDGLIYLVQSFEDKSIAYVEDLCENFVEGYGSFKEE